MKKLLLVFVVAACAPAPSGPTATEARTSACTPLPGRIVAGRGLGDFLKVGEPIAHVAARCRVLWDTITLGGEARPVRMAAIDLGVDTVVADIVNDSVWRLSVTGRALRTMDSVGVGTSIARLLQWEGVYGL